MKLDAEDLKKRIAPLFQENFTRFSELGAAVSVWQNGKPVVDLYGGFCDARREHRWASDTIALIWSATKGLGSVCVLHVLQEHEIDISRRVAEFWPEFAQAGKEKITLAELLSHQAGLCALDRRVDVLNYGAVIRALEEQAPLWPPGTAHGYHARTFGFLLDELVRRIAGEPLAEYWRETFGEPLKLDLWIGLPERENPRVATMYAAKAGTPPEPKQFYVDLITPGALARKAAGEILRDARKRRHMGRSAILFARNFALDDDHAGRWHRSRLSNTNCVFCRLYERGRECEA